MEKNVKFEVEERYFCGGKNLKDALDKIGCSLLIDSVRGEGIVISDSKHRVMRVRPVRSEEQNGRYWIQVNEPLDLIWYDLSVWGYGEKENRKYNKQDLDPKLYELLMETFIQDLYIEYSMRNGQVDCGIPLEIFGYPLLRMLKGLNDAWGCITTVKHDHLLGYFGFTMTNYGCIQSNKTNLFIETMENVTDFIENITTK